MDGTGKQLDKGNLECHVDPMTDARLKRLQTILRDYESCLIAYSGGVDSVLLAKVAHDTLGERSLAVIADSASLPRKELEEALALGAEFGFPVRVVKTKEFNNEEYLANPTNRCFFCKHELFTELEPLAISEGFKVIAYGENASDVGDHRPGAKAARNFQVRAPLKDAALSKADIRELSALLGLPTADKPQMACLSSRIPYGEKVSPQKLSMIERAELVLRDLGFHDVRVRHHELGAAGTDLPAGEDRPLKLNLARIELGPEELPRMFDQNRFQEVATELRNFGYHHVTLDLEGYRRGSLNSMIKQAEATEKQHPSSQ